MVIRDRLTALATLARRSFRRLQAQASYPAMPSPLRARLAFVALAVGTIAVGLVVHWRGTLLPATLRDVLGDALWAMMIGWWIGAVIPDTRVASRAGLALAICWIVEVSQLYHTPLLDAWRRTTFGQLILGTGFDVRDLGAYAVGVLATAVFELSVRRRDPSSNAEPGAAS